MPSRPFTPIARQIKPTSCGVSSMARALAHEACRWGYTALFSNIHKMLQHINGGRSDGTLEPRFQTYLWTDLLALDEFSLRPSHPPAPEDGHDVINERYERGDIMLTANRAPKEWPDLFDSPLLATAGWDRLTHRAQLIVITALLQHAGNSRLGKGSAHRIVNLTPADAYRLPDSRQESRWSGSPCRKVMDR